MVISNLSRVVSLGASRSTCGGRCVVGSGNKQWSVEEKIAVSSVRNWAKFSWWPVITIEGGTFRSTSLSTDDTPQLIELYYTSKHLDTLSLRCAMMALYRTYIRHVTRHGITGRVELSCFLSCFVCVDARSLRKIRCYSSTPCVWPRVPVTPVEQHLSPSPWPSACLACSMLVFFRVWRERFPYRSALAWTVFHVPMRQIRRFVSDIQHRAPSTYYKKWKHTPASCEIEDFVETHLLQAVCDTPIARITSYIIAFPSTAVRFGPPQKRAS